MPERDRQIPYNITHIWNLTYGTNEPFHRKENHGLGEETCGCQVGWEGVGWTGSLGLMPTIASGVHKQWDTAV